MTSLSLDDIANLLGDDSIRPKPKQVGPVRYNRAYGRCARCGVTTCLSVEGDYFCTTHAVYALNQYALDDTIPPDCTCDAGPNTFYNLHTSDCDLYDRITDNAT